MSEIEKLQWVRDCFVAARDNHPDATSALTGVIDYFREAEAIVSLKFNMKMGIIGDIGAVAFYADHDKGDSWATDHLKDGIRAIDRRLKKIHAKELRKTVDTECGTRPTVHKG